MEKPDLHQFITESKEKFFEELNGRIKFSEFQRKAICKKFNYKCATCSECIKDKKFEIDHIRALSNGGTNDNDNLPPLCKTCHQEKTTNEQEDGTYIRVKDSESSFNLQMQSIMDSSLSQTHAFVEPINFDEVNNDKTIYPIDINKCRKKIMYYGKYDYSVFTVFDKPEEFKGS